MKILIISPKFHPVIGGGETYVLNSIQLLHQTGVDVSIAVEPHHARNTKDYPFKVYEVEGLSDTNLNVITASAGLQEIIKQISPDLIHVHGYFALLAIGLCSTRNIPIIASIHSTPVWGERLIGGMDSFDAELSFVRSVLDLAKPQILTAANEVYADAAVKVVQGKVKVIVLPYPVDINFFHQQDNSKIRSEFGLTKDDYLIMTPSRVIERKGIREAVLALDNLPSNFYLCLPGAVDPLDKTYWGDIRLSSVYQKVKHRVLIPKKQFLYNDMPLLYAASDIIAMPSYYEGAPVATVEAMASGKPFVGADSQGINSFIRHNQNGLLVPKKSIRELSEAIYLLSQDKSYREKLSAKALGDIAYLSWDKQLPNLMNAYQDCIVTQEPMRARFTNVQVR